MLAARLGGRSTSPVRLKVPDPAKMGVTDQSQFNSATFKGSMELIVSRD